jgi:hypothetical protein
VAPGSLVAFLDDLKGDYGFNISGDDADRVDSTAQLMALLQERNPCEGAHASESVEIGPGGTPAKGTPTASA